MIKINLASAWKVIVIVLLAIIAFYSYRMSNELSTSSVTPVRVGCGSYGAQSAVPNVCM